MKTKILLLFTCVLSGMIIQAQVNAGQIDDFQNGTTENWTDGGSPVPPVNVNSGGPDGAADRYLRDPSTGGGGPGSKMVMFNDQQWAGNYTAVGIVAIRFDARVLTNTLNLRVAFDGGGGRICTTNAVVVPAGGLWSKVEIPISATDFTLVAGGSNINLTLADVTDMRILSNTIPSWQGESIVSTLEVDNIEAATTLGIDDLVHITSLKISPNPGHDLLKISLKDISNTSTLKVFNVHGVLIMDTKLKHTNTTLTISNWTSGIYFIEISDGSKREVKKFIKV
ncbi:MAG: T9SS type A sorting domain-containing protein [Bacteroidia bacterium]|nr:T9SS type A sorting domain-containing protein [Bacteroidia bacterium]NND25887.1 T9SS type A sorting domain-containing protein [Flavobacteriaceae bacterium]MBT8277854.1 T9SS type A sorting domain-containing protein [Bacteroidia bacterium]NNK59063.1 T9SS type A sorting domain-containing protein [Flavobacteriaceae bacterium]NNL32510.1 T9SS type A sorting domain-containing protein [Flavobacteriaceae bacterium]